MGMTTEGFNPRGMDSPAAGGRQAEGRPFRVNLVTHALLLRNQDHSPLSHPGWYPVGPHLFFRLR